MIGVPLSASDAMFTTAPSGTFAAIACLLKASADFTFGTTERTRRDERDVEAACDHPRLERHRPP